MDADERGLKMRFLFATSKTSQLATDKRRCTKIKKKFVVSVLQKPDSAAGAAAAFSWAEGKINGVKRMRRIAWNETAVVSALLCIATCVLWASNFRQEMYIEHTSLSPYGKNLYFLNWQLWSQDGQLRWSSEGAETNNPRINKDWEEKPGQWRWKIQPRGKSGPLMGFPRNLRLDWYVGTPS